jgi:hypothetical protein
VFAALVIQHAMRVRHFVICGLMRMRGFVIRGLPGSTIFSHSISQTARFYTNK